MRKRFMVGALASGALVVGILMPPTGALAKDGGSGYDSIPHHLPGNLPSVGFEATQTSEFGNQITFAGPTRLGDVTVTMSSWACQQGTWFAGNCVTDPGATFSWPITFNVYATGAVTPGSLIATDTQTFSIPYRPSASPKCTGAQAGEWYDHSSKSCFNGLATNITFHFGGPHPILPASIVFGIAYNTSDYGAVPQRPQPCDATVQGCPYDSLNVALSTDPTDLSAGSDPNTGAVFQNTLTPTNYCDGGTHGVHIFRLDSPQDGCWQVGTGPPNTLPAYIPSVQFKGGHGDGGDGGGDGGGGGGGGDGGGGGGGDSHGSLN